MKLLLITLILALGTVKCAKKWPWENEQTGNCWVKFYDKLHWQGNEKTTYKTSAEDTMNIKSIKVKPGCCVIVYPNRASTGSKRWRICHSFAGIGDWAGNIKSWKIEQNKSSGSCKVTLYNGVGFNTKGRRTEEVYKSKNINWIYGEGVSSIKISKGCCATIFTGSNYKGISKRFCEDQKTLPAVFYPGRIKSNKVKSIRMEQKPFPSCRVEVFPNSNFGGIRTVYRGSVANAVPSITSYRISKGCNAVFFDKPGYQGNQHSDFGEMDWDWVQNSKTWNNKIKSLIIAQDDEPACTFEIKGKNGKRENYYKNEPYYNKDADTVSVPSGCYVTLFSENLYGGNRIRLGFKDKADMLRSNEISDVLRSVKSFIVEQV